MNSDSGKVVYYRQSTPSYCYLFAINLQDTRGKGVVFGEKRSVPLLVQGCRSAKAQANYTGVELRVRINRKMALSKIDRRPFYMEFSIATLLATISVMTN